MNANTDLTIRTVDIHKTYDLGDTSVHALRGVTIDVPSGQFVAIMGASGSGKSTLANILGCLDHPTKGSYYLDGDDVSGFTSKKRALTRKKKIGFVFQGFNLLQRTSALENVEMPLHYARIPARERRQRANEMLAAVGLAGRARHYPTQLSGGQQQRVAIARALINSPSMLLADEPTGNLDSRTSIEIMEMLQRLRDERRLTIVLITHEEEIARFADRQFLMRDGRVRGDRLIEHPADAAAVRRALPPPEEDED